MLIAIDAEPANREKRTGVEAVVFNLICEFMKIEAGNSQHQYVLFTRHELGPHWPQLPANFRHVKLSWPGKYFWSHLRLGWALRRLKPDVTFIPGNIVPPIAPKPIVTVIHDIVFIEHPELHTGKTLASHKYALRQALQKASLIVSPTLATAKAIEKFFPDSEVPVEVVPWGLNHEIYEPQTLPEDQVVLKRFNLEGKKYFLYIGRLEEKKNTPGLMKAFEVLKEKHPEAELVLVGPGGPLGYQPQEVTASLYRHASAFVFPSFYEGFGLPILEAMASGCPAVCSNIDVLKEVGGEAALYFDPHKIEDISEAMEKVWQDDDLRQDLSRKGIARAAAYSWSKSASQILDLVLKTGGKMV